MVVEVKKPLVKIQTSQSERWFRIDQIHAPSTRREK